MKRPESAILDDIKGVYCQLSPENLTCDGELPKYLVQQKYSKLNRELKNLFKELGREVSEEEAYGDWGNGR